MSGAAIFSLCAVVPAMLKHSNRTIVERLNRELGELGLPVGGAYAASEPALVAMFDSSSAFSKL